MTRNRPEWPLKELEMLDALSTAVLLVDENLTIARANTAAESLIESSASKLYRANLAEVLPGADELVGAVRRALLEDRSFSERDLVLRLGKHRKVSVDCNISPLPHAGSEPVHVLVEMTIIDPHQRLQRDEHAQMQDHVSTAMLQGLAHEIKNPLGGIRGAAQLLEGELDDQRLAEYTQVIIGESDRLRALVDRMFGPRGESNKGPVNIHDVLEHVRLIIEAERAGAAPIGRDYDPSIPEVHADRDELVQAMLNLVRNASQAVDPVEGRISLVTRVRRKFTIGNRLHRLVVEVQVVDNGPGIDEELGQSIFFPLVSGRATGSGFGLPIAQSLIKRQDGMIAFSSEPGHTVFSVWLPLGADA